MIDCNIGKVGQRGGGNKSETWNLTFFLSSILEQCPCVATGYKYSSTLACDLPVNNNAIV